MENSVFDFIVTKNNGQELSLDQYRGKVLLIVNTASKCGFTPQYEGLQELYDTYRNKGFEVLAFPCNQFLNQEPLGDKEISEFCSVNFNTTFPVMKKIDVNGSNQSPLFRFLKKKLPGRFGLKRIGWNFTKFLVDKNGKPFRRYAPSTTPEQLKEDIEKLLS